MKCILNIVFFLGFGICFSQDNFPDEPKEYKKIQFVYEQKPNYYIDDRGVFADTLLFKIDFPKLKYRKVKNPNDSTNVCGLVLLRDFNTEDKRKLFSGIIYHTNQTYYCTYDVLKNRTTIKIIRNDPGARELFRKYYGGGYPRFEMEKAFDFNEVNYPLATYPSKTQDISQEIIYTKDRISGIFKEIRDNMLFENIVILNEKLNKKIMPDTIFSNNDFGVQKIITIYDTMTLKSVTYK